MIVNAFLLVLQGVLNVLLLPLSIVNIGVDFIGSIPVVTQFLQVVAYMLPWDNLIPLIVIVFAIFVLRIAISLIRTIISIIPFM